MTLTETNKLLAIIRENWPNHPWADNADRVWHLALEHHPYHVVESALPELFRTLRFAPTPADIVNLVGKYQPDGLWSNWDPPPQPIAQRIADLERWAANGIITPDYAAERIAKITASAALPETVDV
jgi:hypothetical protein